jgi:hypothetical protein
MQYVKKTCAALLFTAALTIIQATAQQQGLVNVDVSNIRTEIAKNINVDVSQVPVTVQVPVSVAATVCDVTAAVLSDQAKSGTASCTAKSDSSALNDLVQKQISQQSTSKPKS